MERYDRPTTKEEWTKVAAAFRAIGFQRQRNVTGTIEAEGRRQDQIKTAEELAQGENLPEGSAFLTSPHQN